ncbi:MAG: hypothetical protein ACK6CU_05895 [Deltaproteobacteria bacterium]|jgi:hypothetical protein
MTLHKEIHFEVEFCAHLAVRRWHHVEADAAGYDRVRGLFLPETPERDAADAVGPARDRPRLRGTSPSIRSFARPGAVAAFQERRAAVVSAFVAGRIDLRGLGNKDVT